MPVGAVHQRRQRISDACVARCATQRLEPRAALVLRPVAQVVAVRFEQVVGEKPTGASASTFFVSGLAADALSAARRTAARGRRFQTTISPSSTVPSGSARAERAELGKALGDQLLAARPEPDLAARA